jgi:hypothetical protein
VKEAVAVFGALVATVVVLTLLTGGALSLGTSPAGPQFSVSFKGPA